MSSISDEITLAIVNGKPITESVLRLNIESVVGINKSQLTAAPLEVAIAYSQYDTVDLLLANGVTVSKRAIQFAIKQRNLKLTHQLCSVADFQNIDSSGLVELALRYHGVIVSLINAGCIVSNFAVEIALEQKNLSLATLLFDRRTIDEPMSTRALTLALKCRRGRTFALKMIADNCNIDKNSLVDALVNHHIEVFDALMSRQCETSVDAFIAAIQQEFVSAVEKLLLANCETSSRAFEAAIESRNRAIINLMFANSVPMSEQLLETAVKCSDLTTARKLITLKCSISDTVKQLIKVKSKKNIQWNDIVLRAMSVRPAGP